MRRSLRDVDQRSDSFTVLMWDDCENVESRFPLTIMTKGDDDVDDTRGCLQLPAMTETLLEPSLLATYNDVGNITGVTN